VVCDQWLGSNGYAGMKALRRAGWSVQVVPEWEFVPVRWRSLPMRVLGRLVRGRAVREFNAELLRAAARFRPELLLVFKGTFVRADTLHALRERGVRSYCFYPDVSTRTHGPYLPDALPAYDMVFTTKRFGLTDLAALGVQRVELLHHAFDPDLHRPVPLAGGDFERYGCAVSFIGTWSPKKERFLQKLREARPEIAMRIWGAQWDRARSRELRNVIARHTVEGEEYVRAIRASTINIALLSERRVGASEGDQVTSRTFHIPAAGGFMLHERTPELLEILREGEEVACFDGEAELVESVGRWLADPAGRERIALGGAELVRQAHGWDTRIQELLNHLPASRLGS
jgi:glycosyltransferase involved in cell wall biosynthesis